MLFYFGSVVVVQGRGQLCSGSFRSPYDRRRVTRSNEGSDFNLLGWGADVSAFGVDRFKFEIFALGQGYTLLVNGGWHSRCRGSAHGPWQHRGSEIAAHGLSREMSVLFGWQPERC